MQEIDFLIVGQGLAGTVLAWKLLERGKKIAVIDAWRADTEGGQATPSSRIAAGLINPITGWRIVKSWRIDELLPEARKTYSDLGDFLGVSLWKDRKVIRTIRNVEEENQWFLRASYPENAAYCEREIFTNFMKNSLKDFRAFAHILKAAQVNLPLLLESFEKYLLEKKLLTKENFEYQAIQLPPNEQERVIYKNFSAQKIIFCEGAQGAQNPFFAWLPFRLDKGELLLVEIPDFMLENVFRNKLAIIPLPHQKALFWVGATNEWHFSDDQPTAARLQDLESELKAILKIPFRIIAHQAAIRPTVRDRRPFVGLHPSHPSLAIFNGLGTKGTSLAPFWANHFVDFLLHKTLLESEIDIARIKI